MEPAGRIKLVVNGVVPRERRKQQQLQLLPHLIHQQLNHQICFGDNKLIFDKIVKLSFNKIVLIRKSCDLKNSHLKSIENELTRYWQIANEFSRYLDYWQEP